MINSKMRFEKILQNFRFSKVKGLLNGDVLDFGGNDGELEQFVKGSYTLVNYDHTLMYGKKFDVIILLAVIEHIDVEEVHRLFNVFRNLLNDNGIIVLTTPTPQSKWLLEMLAHLNILDKQNIEEHKHYWNRDDIYELANRNGFSVKTYNQFQAGFNQFSIFTGKI
jgi:2-polyprenyl-3-methyl-5-hydroxy-6-metoxy-1,4-benzoquinol methylase